MSVPVDIRFGGLLALTLIAILGLRRRKSRGPPLPPGPTPLPFLGNVLSINGTAPWLTYTEWGTVYGDITYSRLLEKEVIVLNTEEAASSLLEGRSRNYSDRPSLPTIELFGIGVISSFLHYGDEWRQHRRLFHQVLRPQAVCEYEPVQMRESYRLLANLLDDSQHYPAHLELHSAAIIMSVIYGYDTVSRNDPLVTTVQNAIDVGLKVSTPEKTALLDALPFLYYLPSWFPGATFKQDAALCRKHWSDMIEVPYQYVKNEVAAGTEKVSMVADALKRYPIDETSSVVTERAIKNSAGAAFSAGAESTHGTLMTFLYAMILNPGVRQRAQAEIDSIVGNDRLPRFEDRASLPYVDAILRETLRWHPIAPLGVAHATTNADTFQGMHIPKGALVMANIWAMSQNAVKYPDPSEFKPERFLTAEGGLTDDKVPYAFGFGRRVCPGRHLAEASLWSAMVVILAVFDVTKPIDELGNEVDFEPKWATGLNSHPLPFPCRIVPRSAEMDRETLAHLISSAM
ncbi:cytochrome P450 [Leucogyrophana mollusca]|uniref:Cytochrome P450 n=1 Tax=Leucogyrophana mollusca TaxID=85980 RepID=A0ACB8BBY2_9AGAM|nr:cytochrome P450 [Leucogyrophana mollusca]